MHPIKTAMKRFIDNDYKAADLEKTVADQTQLETREQQKLLALLKRFEDLFQCKLGTWNCPPVDLELKPGAMPYHGRPYTPPRAYVDQVKKECKHLCDVGVLREITSSEWGHPTFIIPKKNNGI